MYVLGSPYGLEWVSSQKTANTMLPLAFTWSHNVLKGMGYLGKIGAVEGVFRIGCALFHNQMTNHEKLGHISRGTLQILSYFGNPVAMVALPVLDVMGTIANLAAAEEGPALG